MRKKILVIIIILLVLILLLGGAFAYAYFFTDMFKSNKEIFLKYISQNEEIIQLFKDENIKAYSEKQKNTPYTTKGKLETNVTFSDSTNQEMATALQNCSVTFEGQVDNVNKFNHQIVKANYSDSQALTFELLKNDDIYSFKLNDVVDKFIGIQNKDLKTLAAKFGMSEEQIAIIPDKIDFEKIQNFKLFTEEEFLQIKDKYMNIIINDLADEMFSREQNSQSDAYVLTVDSKHAQKILKDILIVVKDDEMLLNKIKTIMTQELNMPETDVNQSIDSMKQSIEKMVSENTESVDNTADTEKLLIKVHVNNKKLSKTEFIFKEESTSSNTTTDNYDATVGPTSANSDEEHKLIVEKIENGINIVIQSDDLDKEFKATIQKTMPVNEIKYDISTSYGDEKLFDLSIRFFEIQTDEVVETSELTIESNLSDMYSDTINPKSTYSYTEESTSSSINKMVWTFSNTKKFTTEISKEGIDSSNALLINTAPNLESIQNTFKQLGDRLVQVNKEKMTAAGLGDDKINPFAYYMPGIVPMSVIGIVSAEKTVNIYSASIPVLAGISISMLSGANNIYNKARETAQETDLTSLEIETFNLKFESYSGANKHYSDIVALYNMVLSSNSKEEINGSNRKITINGENITAIPEMDNTKTYNVVLEYNSNGYVNNIVITTANNNIQESTPTGTTSSNDTGYEIFNAKFESYTGERQGKSPVNSLIALVNSSNTTSEHKVEVEVTKIDGAKINGLENYTAEGNMYSVEMEKDADGYINKIIITEVL